ASYFKKEFNIPERETKIAAKEAYQAYHVYQADIKEHGARALDFARAHGKYVIVLSGRPYHVDPEINHGIDRLISSYGLVIVTEDAVADYVTEPKVAVLNQWTYHARLYAAAKFVTESPNAQLIQLVSFGCGTDAITTDAVRDICEQGGKLYTQIKIDEIANLGAVKIRIRSLLAAMDSRSKEKHYG
ncbi:MAG TPA: 2-hydroxyglutaryl-CoA dehydratase, partial [Ruminococcaceae bacterium]|nr:2-hydroxyglutaryl-CoA dehydratase [Oscillospiraceae bacterium]